MKKCKLAASQCGRSCISPKKACRISAKPDTVNLLTKVTDTITAKNAPEIGGDTIGKLNNLIADLDKARAEAGLEPSNPKEVTSSAPSKDLKNDAAKTLEKSYNGLTIKHKDLEVKDYRTFKEAWSESDNEIKISAERHYKVFPQLTASEALAMAQWNQSASTFRDFNDKIRGTNDKAKPLIKSLSDAIDKFPKFGAGVLSENPVQSKDKRYTINSNRLSRFLDLNSVDKKRLTDQSVFEGFMAFTHDDNNGKRDHFFEGRGLRIELNAKEKSSGAMIDGGKARWGEREVLFKPNSPIRLRSVQVGDKAYKTIADAKKDPDFFTKEVTVNADEL